MWSQAFGIDKSASQIDKAISRHQQQSDLSFHQIEAWDLNSVLKLAAGAGVQFNVVFIDVSGSRRVGDVDELILKYEQVCTDIDLHMLKPINSVSWLTDCIPTACSLFIQTCNYTTANQLPT